MKKILAIAVLFSLLVLPAIGLATCDSDGVCETANGETPDNCSYDCVAPDLDVFTVLNRIVNWLFTALLIFAAIMIIIAAFNFVTAAGDPETVAKARHFVMYALIGVAVALLARGLVSLVQTITG